MALLPNPWREPTMMLVPAGKALGINQRAAYWHAQRGTFPVEVLRVGRTMRVRTADVYDALNLPLPARADDVLPAGLSDERA